MSKIRRNRGGLVRADRKATGKKRDIRWRRLADMVLVVAAILMVIYAVSVAARVFDSYTIARSTPFSSIRLQVIDASGETGLLAAALSDMEAIADETMALKIVETTDFDLRRVNGSFVVSRQIDCRAARILAERLGLEPDEVEYRPLVNDRRQITATLVLGTSGVGPVVAESQKEET